MTAVAYVDDRRLWQTLAEFGRIGRHDDGSINRVCFTPEEEHAHAQVAEWLTDAGLKVHRDAFGNTIGIRPGRSQDAPAIAIGSHADSVPQGGNFDGAVGVVAAVEIVRALADADAETNHPLMVVCFSAEEGARFGAPCLGSKASIGRLTSAELNLLRDREGIRLIDALTNRGGDPDLVVVGSEWAEQAGVFIELHIEQGRVLEEAGEPVGVVGWVAGNRRLRMSVTGRTDHSGATPMHLRSDALIGAAEIAVQVERLARLKRGVVGTVGEFAVRPGAMTAVPGNVDLSVDVRSGDDVLQEQTVLAVEHAARRIAATRDLDLSVDDVSKVAPILLQSWVRRTLVEVSNRVTGYGRVMTSGAGHDAAIIARRIPSGMVFIPSRNGLSHSPLEYTAPEHLALGTQVLLEAVLELDHMSSFARATMVPGDAGGGSPYD